MRTRSTSTPLSISLGFTLLMATACAPVPPPPPPAYTAAAVDHVTLEAGEPAPEALTSFSPEERRSVVRAIATADSIVGDSTFRRHLRALDGGKAIDWDRGQRDNVPRPDRRRATAWFLGRFASEGNFTVAQVHAEDADSTIATVAWTWACKPGRCALETYLNPWYITSWERTGYPYGLTNTMVHERVHAFGLKHGRGQKRWPNVCDLAYVAGDLAEVMLRSRAAGAAVEEDRAEPLCPALRRHLVRARLLVG